MFASSSGEGRRRPIDLTRSEGSAPEAVSRGPTQDRFAFWITLRKGNNGLLVTIGLLCLVVSFACWLVIFVDIYQNDGWGDWYFVFGTIYVVYYGFTQFEHEHKYQILGGMLGFGALGLGLLALGPR